MLPPEMCSQAFIMPPPPPALLMAVPLYSDGQRMLLKILYCGQYIRASFMFSRGLGFVKVRSELRKQEIPCHRAGNMN